MYWEYYISKFFVFYYQFSNKIVKTVHLQKELKFTLLMRILTNKVDENLS